MGSRHCWYYQKSNTQNIQKYQIIQRYWAIYIYLVQAKRYRHVISRLRFSTHILHIEKGRYTRPRTPLHERLCYVCNCAEDELHFVTTCSLNFTTVRTVLYDKVAGKFPEFDTLDGMGKFVFLFTFKDAQMLTWLGKFLYKSFTIISSQWNSNVMFVTTSGWRYTLGIIMLRATNASGDAVAGPHATIFSRTNYRGLI